MTFTEECHAFAGVIKSDFAKPVAIIRNIRRSVNYYEESDFIGTDNNEVMNTENEQCSDKEK